jgi:hypothetical protein
LLGQAFLLGRYRSSWQIKYNITDELLNEEINTCPYFSVPETFRDLIKRFNDGRNLLKKEQFELFQILKIGNVLIDCLLAFIIEYVY